MEQEKKPVIAVDEQFKILADAAPVLIWASGADKLCYFFNTGWLRFTGRSPEQEYGNGWMQGVHPDDLQRCLNTYSLSFHTRKEFKMAYRLRRYDGEYRRLVVHGVPRFSPQGDLLGFTGSCMDIEGLPEPAADLKAMVMVAHYSLMILRGREFVVEIANQQLANLWNRSLDDITGRKLLDILPEIKDQPFPALLHGVFDTGKPYSEEEERFQVITAAGPLDKYVRFYYDPIFDTDGNVSGIIVTADDITEKVLARRLLEDSYREQQALNEEMTATNEEITAVNEELAATNEELSQTQAQLQRMLVELEASGERFRVMMDAIPQQVWTAQPDGTLNYVNQIVCSDFGFATEEIVGHGWQKFIHPDDLDDCLKKWTSSLQSNTEYVAEFRLLFRDGTYHWHLARAVPLRDNGTVTLWLGTNTDIELQKSNEQRKDEFLSIASHELKTPLTSIKAFNQLMKRATVDDKIRAFVNKSSEHIYRLEKLIADLLDVTKINAGKMNYTFEPFDFGQMITASIENFQYSTTHQIVLDPLPAISYTGDQLRLEQVMNNFLTNAVKYSPNNTEVHVKCQVERDNIIVSVQDFGIGIAPENLGRLFERYYRVDNTAMRFEGLGLGLFISSEILKRHRGSFWIESTPGAGSTFYFRLPLAPHNEAKRVTKTDFYYEDTAIKVRYNKAHERLEVDWTGFQNMETVQNGGMIMLEMLSRCKCRKVLNDNTHVLGSWSEAADWAGKEWFPMMEQAGLEYFAWIYSPNVFSQLSAKRSVDLMMGNVVAQFFTDITVAGAWLDSKAPR